MASHFYSLHLTSVRLTNWMLLIKVSAAVTVYRGYCRTLFFLPRIISLFIMCLGIIWNNSLVGGCARAEVWTPAPENITLHCAHGARVLWPVGYMGRSFQGFLSAIVLESLQQLTRFQLAWCIACFLCGGWAYCSFCGHIVCFYVSTFCPVDNFSVLVVEWVANFKPSLHMSLADFVGLLHIIYRRAVQYVQTWCWGCVNIASGIKTVIFRVTENLATDSNQRTHYYSFISITGWWCEFPAILPGICSHGRIVSSTQLLTMSTSFFVILNA